MSHLSNKSSHFNQLETRISISHQNLSSISKCTWNSLWTPANDNKYVITYVIIKVAGYHHVSCASQDSTQEHNHQVTKWSVSNAPCILLYMALLYLWAGFLLQFCPKNFRSFERVITDHQSQAIWEVAKIYTMQLILLRLDEKALRKSWPGCNLLFEWKVKCIQAHWVHGYIEASNIYKVQIPALHPSSEASLKWPKLKSDHPLK